MLKSLLIGFFTIILFIKVFVTRLALLVKPGEKGMAHTAPPQIPVAGSGLVT